MIYKFERKLKGANQVEATGEELTINNAGRKVQKFELSGRSEQKTRSGYNLANLDADSFVKNGVTVTNNGDGSWTFNGTSSSSGDLILTKNILLNNKIYQFEDTKYLFKTIVVSGSFSNPDKIIVQTSAMGQDNGVDNFATLYNKLSDGVFVNIFNKKSTSHLSRFELYCGPNVTFNNYTIKILFAKTDNKELEWQQYGASPSVEFLSKIENVGDNINLYNKNDTTLILDAPISNNAVGTRASGTYKTVYIPCEPNTSYVVTKKYDETKNRLIVACSTEIPNYSQTVEVLGKDENATELTVVTSNTAKYLLAYVWIIGGSTTVQEMLDSIKIEEGTKATSLSDYNNASIKVTACNKNIATWDNQNILFANTVSNSIDNNIVKAKGEDGAGLLGYSGGIVRILFNKKLELNKEYVVSIKAKLRSVGKWSKETQFMFGDNTKWSYESKILELSLNTYILCTFEIKPRLENEDRLTIYLNGNEVEFDLDTLQIEEGSTASLYIPNQERTKTFPLEEGQKLYEGSYLAKDGIHNMRRQDILIGEESLKNYHSDTSNGFVGFSFIMSNKHKKNADFLCTHLTKNSDNVYYNRGLGGWLPDEDRWCYICVPISILKDVSTPEKQIESMKEYLKEQYNVGTPMKFEYELATEEIIPYTQEQQEIYSQLQNLKLFRGCNHITAESNIKPTMKLNYYDGELDMTDYKYNLQFKKHMQEM